MLPRRNTQQETPKPPKAQQPNKLNKPQIRSSKPTINSENQEPKIKKPKPPNSTPSPQPPTNPTNQTVNNPHHLIFPPTPIIKQRSQPILNRPNKLKISSLYIDKN